MAGYSGRSLAQKLGIKEADRVLTIGAPAEYRRLLAPLPPKVTLVSGHATGARLVHLFVRRRATLESELARLRQQLPETAAVWVSWPKKASGVESDVTEDVIRDVALPLGFVDIKVCAVNDIWSGLKLVIRRSERGRRA